MRLFIFGESMKFVLGNCVFHSFLVHWERKKLYKEVFMKHTGKVTLLTAALLALSAHAVAAETLKLKRQFNQRLQKSQRFNQQQKRQQLRTLLFQQILKRRRYSCV